LLGPVVGAFFLTAMQHYLAQLGSWVTVVQGIIFVFCVMVFRRGIVGVIASYAAGLRKPPGTSTAAAERPAEATIAAAPGAPGGR
jgi:branched-chain amino acid transport system permease protein